MAVGGGVLVFLGRGAAQVKQTALILSLTPSSVGCSKGNLQERNWGGYFKLIRLLLAVAVFSPDIVPSGWLC